MSGRAPDGRPPDAGKPQLDPTVQEAEVALTSGLLDRAAALFLARLESEPGDVLAVVGLAQVELERGDDRRACEIARWALRLDPGDDLAVRMVSRLEEVMRYRGETPPPPSDGPPAGIPVPTARPGAASPTGNRVLDRLTGRGRSTDQEEP
jgi:hypothetical protein